MADNFQSQKNKDDKLYSLIEALEKKEPTISGKIDPEKINNSPSYQQRKCNNNCFDCNKCIDCVRIFCLK